MAQEKLPWYMDEAAAKAFKAFDAKHPEVFAAFRLTAQVYVDWQADQIKEGVLASDRIRVDARRVLDDIRCELRKHVRSGPLAKSTLRGISNKWSHWYAAKLMKSDGMFADYFKKKCKQ